MSKIDEFLMISSQDNDKIKLYKKLLEDKKERKKQHLFVIEGVRLVADAVGENIDIDTIFITELALEKYPSVREIIADKKVYFITEKLARYLSDTDKPQGIFAICSSNFATTKTCDDIKANGKYILLDELQDPGNMGTILRSADACGIDGVFLCGCCDVFSSKVIRSTMGSLFRVNIAVMDIDTAIEKLKSNGITIYSAVIDKNAKSLVECDFTKGCAVMIGNEGNGLSEEHIALSNIPMTIKMKGRLNSLNAAMAAGIIMWEMSEKV